MYEKSLSCHTQNVRDIHFRGRYAQRSSLVHRILAPKLGKLHNDLAPIHNRSVDVFYRRFRFLPLAVAHKRKAAAVARVAAPRDVAVPHLPILLEEGRQLRRARPERHVEHEEGVEVADVRRRAAGAVRHGHAATTTAAGTAAIVPATTVVITAPAVVIATTAIIVTAPTVVAVPTAAVIIAAAAAVIVATATIRPAIAATAVVIAAPTTPVVIAAPPVVIAATPVVIAAAAVVIAAGTPAAVIIAAGSSTTVVVAPVGLAVIAVLVSVAGARAAGAATAVIVRGPIVRHGCCVRRDNGWERRAEEGTRHTVKATHERYQRERTVRRSARLD